MMVDHVENMAHVRAVQDKYTQQLLRKPHVVGVSVGRIGSYGGQTGKLGLVVLVDYKIPDDQLDPEDRLPRELEGVPVAVREVGSLEAL